MSNCLNCKSSLTTESHPLKKIKTSAHPKLSLNKYDLVSSNRFPQKYNSNSVSLNQIASPCLRTNNVPSFFQVTPKHTLMKTNLMTPSIKKSSIDFGLSPMLPQKKNFSILSRNIGYQVSSQSADESLKTTLLRGDLNVGANANTNNFMFKCPQSRKPRDPKSIINYKSSINNIYNINMNSHITACN